MYDFTPLRHNIPNGDVFLPGDDGYEEVLQRWSAACVKRAVAVVLPINSQEVSTAVKFAVSNRIPMTVCGGGHSSSGASSTEGMVIDLRKMQKVKVNAEAMTVEFEGGCLWEGVDTALERHDLATVGGVVNHTGVGGLTLGGGHGFLTPRHGLTIDNLLKAEVVLADGTIVEASEDTNQDLFWAIRGAGAQFGVVTRFVSRAHRQDKVWSGTLAYSADNLRDLLQFANVLYGRPNSEGHCFALGIGFGPDETSRVVSAIPLYHGSEVDAKRYFSGLLEIEAIADDTEMMTTAKTNTLLNSVMDHGIRRLMGSGNITMPLDFEPMLQTAEKFWKFCESHDGMGKSVLAIEFFPTDKIREVPQDATAYANRGDYYDAMTSFAWENPDYDTEIRQFNRSLCKRIRETNGYSATAGGHWSKGPVGVYINIEADSISPKDAWGVNLPKLREVKRKFDPNNVFNKWHGIAEDTTGTV
ncbi:6-hydroxy-D-nicotine oxidase [Fusarium pseudocircinatum]|uniref:6-hydroxy-D-nicotine oxidase n=1 Tax=Fusarium pseudocircinatum TaxID=56676 RepID=A0A8H5LAY6_9HYPO|nr:6-hydroxy-D-nicotine oxidase [Fusarium pseudocircinatum]